MLRHAGTTLAYAGITLASAALASVTVATAIVALACCGATSLQPYAYLILHAMLH